MHMQQQSRASARILIGSVEVDDAKVPGEPPGTFGAV